MLTSSLFVPGAIASISYLPGIYYSMSACLNLSKPVTTCKFDITTHYYENILGDNQSVNVGLKSGWTFRPASHLLCFPFNENCLKLVAESLIFLTNSFL